MTNMNSKEYVSNAVPQEKRKHFLRLLPIWVGFILVVGVMSVGSGLAAGMDKNSAFNAIILGNLVLGVFAGISGFVGAHSGKSFSLLVEDSFTGVSSRLVSLYAPITLIGWYAVQASIFGSLIGQIFGFTGIAENIITLFAALLFSVTCYFGFRVLGLASMVLVPLIVLLCIYALWGVYDADSGNYAFGSETIDFETGFSLVVGSWILGVIASLPDISRYSKSAWSGALLGFLGIFIFNSLGITVGLLGAVYAETSDPASILLVAGAPVLALILGIANIWTTNDNNLYSASLGIARSLKIDRRKAVVGSALLGALVAFSNPSNFDIFFKFLFFLGNTAPALGGVVLGTYFYRMFATNLRASNLAGWSGWILGSFTSTTFSGITAIVSGAISAFIIYIIVSKIETSLVRAHD